MIWFSHLLRQIFFFKTSSKVTMCIICESVWIEEWILTEVENGRMRKGRMEVLCSNTHAVHSLTIRGDLFYSQLHSVRALKPFISYLSFLNQSKSEGQVPSTSSLNMTSIDVNG